MPTFKHKTNKKIEVDDKTLVTLDNKHNEFVSKFENYDEETIPALAEEKDFLISEINSNSLLSLDELLDMKDRIKEINTEIRELEREKKEYYLSNTKHIFSYFEKKKQQQVEPIKQEVSSRQQMLNTFFKKKDTDSQQTVQAQQNNNNNQSHVTYLKNVDERFIDVNDYVVNHETCACNGGELIPVESDGILVCNKCGRQYSYLIDSDKPSYKEPPQEVCFYAYKRINHFKEILSQFQAKETTQIPDEVIENIKLQIKKERISATREHLPYSVCKEILKKLNYNKYYEHINFIKHKLGIPPPNMSPQLEDKLCNLFLEIEKYFSKHCPNVRVNFLGYYYVLYKFCELLGENKYLSEIPMLKDDDKKVEQDEIWRKICYEMGWTFYPTC
jgi:hypothetical protein